MRAITYHRVSTRSDPASPYAAITTTAAELAAHAAELTRHWCVLTLEEVAATLAEGRPLPPRSVHISFDDGFRDNLTAAEILERHRLPWTLFAVADAVLSGIRPWYVRLADALADGTGVVEHQGRRFDLDQPRGRAALKAALKGRVMAAPVARHLEVLEAGLAEAGLGEPDTTGSPFLSTGELRELAARGVEVGNHSASHPNLTACTQEELDSEIVASRTRLEDAVGRPVRFFAYPDSRWDQRVLAVTGTCHDLAMAGWTANQPLAPLRLRRFPPGPGVEGLREVLSDGYPARYRLRRAKWALRRAASRVRG